MTPENVATFFAVLCLLTLVGILASAALLVAGRRAHPEGRLGRIREDVGRAAFGLAFVVALVATLGSLYLSEVAHYTPCKLCWYQRIAMYPLPLLLAVALVRRETVIRGYVAAVAGVGASIAVYHSWIQAFPPTGGSSFCTLDAPCTERYVWEFGFVSIPFMALSAFVFVVMMMALAPTDPIRSRP